MLLHTGKPPGLRDLYKEAIAEGKRLAEHDIISAEYWTARHAARETASALLAKARQVGVTEEQWEALRAVAAEVAYD